MPSPGCPRNVQSLAGRTVLVNMSGRGDKDVAQMMDVLAGPAVSGRPGELEGATVGAPSVRWGEVPGAVPDRWSAPAGPATWTTTLPAIAAAGPTASRSGIPFSDPVMDGPVIQEASERALAGGRHAGVDPR